MFRVAEFFGDSDSKGLVRVPPGEGFPGQELAGDPESAGMQLAGEVRRPPPPSPLPPRRHVVAASLFWKPVVMTDGPYPVPTREILKDPASHGVTGQVNHPWIHFVEPLLAGARRLKKERPDVAFRVYLANDLAFLIPDLTEAGCEIALMESSSIAHNPGAMWRFLAMKEEGLVTITDAERADDVIYDVERTELVAEAGLGHWRVPYTWGNEETRRALASHYRPILACQFGSARSYPMDELMAAFIWHHRKGTLSTTLQLGGRTRNIFGTTWPDYGFDEWFLLAAMHPRMAFEGVLTFVPWEDRSLNQWFALDIEYCTWANPKSEILYHDTPLLKRVESLDKKTLWIDENGEGEDDD